MSVTRWKLTIEYDGLPFSGWQCQDHIISVQEVVEEAIRKFSQQDIRIHAAGRTDAGVHACGQVAHFDLDYGDRLITGYALSKAINAHLTGHAVSILTAEVVPDTFHARFSATNKLYTYRILNRPARPALDLGKVWHVKRPLNAVAMHEAAQVLTGYQDFTSFRATRCQAKTPMRSLDRADIVRTGDYIECHFEGRSFLHHQVRNMVGTLSMVGEGKWTKENVSAALAAKDRAKAGPTAPPDGLYLMRIDYA